MRLISKSAGVDGIVIAPSCIAVKRRKEVSNRYFVETGIKASLDTGK